MQRPSTTDMPRIGWTQGLPVAGLETWEDVRLVGKDMALFDLAKLADSSGGRCAPTEEVFALFREHSLAVRDCAGRGAAVTDRHPHWPGLWVSAENESGAVCDRSRLDWKESLQQIPHVVHLDQARPAGRLTGKEQTVQCRHCDAHVTGQHPDWPDVWVEATGYNTPVCAVLGSGGRRRAGVRPGRLRLPTRPGRRDQSGRRGHRRRQEDRLLVPVPAPLLLLISGTTTYGAAFTSPATADRRMTAGPGGRSAGPCSLAVCAPARAVRVRTVGPAPLLYAYARPAGRARHAHVGTSSRMRRITSLHKGL